MRMLATRRVYRLIDRGELAPHMTSARRSVIPADSLETNRAKKIGTQRADQSEAADLSPIHSVVHRFDDPITAGLAEAAEAVDAAISKRARRPTKVRVPWASIHAHLALRAPRENSREHSISHF